MGRLDEPDLWSAPHPYDYEAHLRRAFEHARVERRLTPMVFFKVRHQPEPEPEPEPEAGLEPSPEPGLEPQPEPKPWPSPSHRSSS